MLSILGSIDDILFFEALKRLNIGSLNLFSNSKLELFKMEILPGNISETKG
jgi:hypothetical protein